jgi:hypothetical protein
MLIQMQKTVLRSNRNKIEKLWYNLKCVKLIIKVTLSKAVTITSSSLSYSIGSFLLYMW